MYLEVQMRTGRVAGRADGTDRLAGLDRVPGAHVEAAQVAVPRLRAVVVCDDDLVAVREVVGGGGDLAGGRRHDRRPFWCGEVETGVVLRPQAATLTEGGGDRVVGHRHHPAVQPLDAALSHLATLDRA